MVLGKLRGRGGILSRREQELRDRESELLERLEAALAAFDDAAGDDLAHLHRARAQLDQLFLLVVAGEFNSGKSSFINALIGERVLPEGVTPTTDRITLLRWAEEAEEKAVESFVIHRTHPAEVLRELNIVDTPGTNAVIRRHEELTREFVPRSDLVLFVTSADRPFTETERVFLEHIREWGKKVVVVINKIDILESDADRDEVMAFVRRNAAELLGREPEVFALSARRALRALEEEDASLWTESGFDGVQTYLLETLDEEERVRLKLLNPLNVGLRLAGQYKNGCLRPAQGAVGGHRGDPGHRPSAHGLPPGHAGRPRGAAGEDRRAAAGDGATRSRVLRGDDPDRPDQVAHGQ